MVQNDLELIINYFTLQQSDASMDPEMEKEVVKNDGSESEEADLEGGDSDNAEAEYLIEFEETKKLQVHCE